MRIRIDIKTPPNQAENCIEKNKKVFLSRKTRDTIIEQGITDHNEFYWVLDLDESQLLSLHKKCHLGETAIKTFYRTLIKTIRRANWLSKKFGKGMKWIRRWINRKVNKTMRGKDKDEFLHTIESMTDQEINTWIEIEDEEEMKDFLTKPIITITQTDD